MKRIPLVALAVAWLSFGYVGGVQAADDDADLAALLDVGGKPEGGVTWSGYGEFGMARDYLDPAHWSKLRGRLELTGTGDLGPARWKVSGRMDEDAAYSFAEDYYPTAVRRDQRQEFKLREAYFDLSDGDWDYRIGRQQVVWGEVVGIFVADVVSARDMREFYLPDFESMRIPQWAARAEYFNGDFHGELLWIPFPSYDDIGKPGAEFYPIQVPAGVKVLSEDRPAQSMANSNFGARASTLIAGWDMSAFIYRSSDVNPTFYIVGPGELQARHDRITQVGATVTKDMGSYVLKGEVVNTQGRKFATYGDGGALTGLHDSGTLDYVLGIDVPTGDWDINVQGFSRVFYSQRDEMDVDRNEPGATLRVNRKFGDDWEAQVLIVSSLKRNDYMFRPKVVWRFAPNWTSRAGFDIFGGKPDGLFGRYDHDDRVYVDVRRDF